MKHPVKKIYNIQEKFFYNIQEFLRNYYNFFK